MDHRAQGYFENTQKSIQYCARNFFHSSGGSLMTRTSLTSWLSALSCAALLAAISGCGSSGPANKTGNAGTNGGDAAAGSTGSGGSGGGTGGSTTDASGQAGATAGSGGATAGSGGATGGAGGATGGTDGGAAGATGGADGGTAGAGGNSDAGADVPPTPCVSGGDCSGDFSCSITRTCNRNQEQLCFCAPNGKIACEPCEAADAGADAGPDGSTGDAGGTTDGGVAMCPANVMTRVTACATANARCQGTCTNMRQDTCLCFNPPGGDNANHWYCTNLRCQ
jgi:hypothetical protein